MVSRGRGGFMRTKNGDGGKADNEGRMDVFHRGDHFRGLWSHGVSKCLGNFIRLYLHICSYWEL
jgi:hypothetical protein